MNLVVPAPARRSAVLAVALSVGAGLVAQTTVAIGCDRDNTLYESATGSLSNARGYGLFVGVTGQPAKRRTLVHFNVAGVVPGGARVVNCRLELNVSRTAAALPFDAMVHRVIRNWGEGTSNASGQEGAGAPATTNDATWRHAFYPSTFWTTPGGDFVATPSCAMSTPPLGLAVSPPSAGMNADVQHWVDNPTQNFGWLLKTDELIPYKARRFDSREAGTGGIRPSLVVTYLLPGQVANVGQGCPVGGQPFTTAMAGLPVGGNTVNLVQANGPAGNLAANLLALSFDPIGAPLLPACALHLPLGALVTHNLFLLDGAGAGVTPFAVPVGFTGLVIAGQGAALDGTPAGYVLSNAWVALLN